MASINRTIQFKRNTNIAPSAASAKLAITNISGTLANGEIVIGSYTDAKAVNGVAHILAIKGQDKIFFDDNQVILNKIGIKDDGTVDPDAAADSLVKLIDDLASGASDTLEVVEAIIEAAGLESGGTYSADASDIFLSGATSLKNADKKLSDEIKAVEDFIGMGEGSSGQSIVEKIDEISGDVETLSGKTLTTVVDSATIDFSIGEATDGTKSISGDVKLSVVSGGNNIILTKEDGLYANVDYNSLTNALVVNGIEKPLNAGSIVDGIDYDSETEKIIITYHTTTSSEEQTVEVDVKDLIEEYSFADSGTTDYNVAFKVVRSVSGATTVHADVNNFDCGEY